MKYLYLFTVSLMINMVLFKSSMAEIDLCNANVIHSVGSVESADYMLEKGEVLDSITQFNVNKHTGLREFCVHGGFCYPETIKINGKEEKSLKLTNCTINKKIDEDADTEFWSLNVIRSQIDPKKLRLADISDKLIEMGLCSACADNSARYYVNKPDSKCGLLVKSALEGNKKSFSDLMDSPDYCY